MYLPVAYIEKISFRRQRILRPWQNQWPFMPEQSDQTLRRKAERLGVKLAFLSEYAAAPLPEYDHTLVINYGGLAPDRLQEAVSLLEDVFAEA